MDRSGNSDHIPINSWAEDEQPREKLLQKGVSALSNAELLAILLQSGTRQESALSISRRLLQTHGEKLSKLGKASIQDLKGFRGVGNAKAVTVRASMELGKRRREERSGKEPHIRSSHDVYELMRGKLEDLPHEEFWVIFLNRANKLLSRHLIGRGGLSGTVADTRLIFKWALQDLASSMILCHNHPSGNIEPSKADRTLTRKLKDAGELMDIPVLDHLIIGEQDHYSFADEELL
ncbi:MAG: DNA repair protein RadC [Flavobacteriales bacterium]